MKKILELGKKGVRELFLLPTHLYRVLISPFLPPSCIYTPTCSHYMVESVRKHGIFKGATLGVFRISRCHHVLFYGGVDPVPPLFSKKELLYPYKIFFRRRGKKDSSSS
ncbi:MAG: membrane protein insertion efficiency factor YidD [Spirochaetia bacterium]|nr:membrane protein insertion efficiency factor YidD [Spirochaetia bacterium]